MDCPRLESPEVEVHCTNYSSANLSSQKRHGAIFLRDLLAGCL